MRFIVSVTLYIPCLAVWGSAVFNWEEFQLVAMRKDRHMSPLYVPAISIVPDDGYKLEHENKMILDTGSEDSHYHAMGCKRDFPSSVRIKLSLGKRNVVNEWVLVDCNEPHLSGRVGVGPFSPFMKAVRKLELTIKNRRYSILHAANEVNEEGYLFADRVRHDRFPGAWAVEGTIEVMKRMEKKIKIVFRTRSSPALRHNDRLFKVHIFLFGQGAPIAARKRESFILRGDQFFFIDDHTIAVNPIVLGYRRDISILFESSGRKPRMGLKVLPIHF